jgi:uncharacterized protein with NAD-binding domain and iron-sulfur cluster
VLGGGCGAMTAAYYLTSTPELCAKYEVTVYQQGWRLGGKGASGRNAALGQRIEEHGLHLWMGFYENAFRTIRACYDEWRKAPDNPFQSWQDAFAPQYEVTLMERVVKDGRAEWLPWTLVLPPTPGTPGDADGMDWADVVTFVRRLGQWIEEALERLGGAKLLDDLPDDLRRLAMMVDLGAAMVKGLFVDVLPHGRDGFRRIDHLDLRAWLVSHGALPQVAAEAAPLRAIYDLAFAYVGGDANDPGAAQMAAGAGAKLLLSIALGYKGAPLWRMRAGMGDTIFTPFYEVLRERGVRFEFFRRVQNLSLTGDGKAVEAIELARQAETKGPHYRPLVPVRGLPCWPSEPLWEQLVDGARLRAEGVNFESSWCKVEVGRQVLERGRDFDDVVLGISLAGLQDCCRELIERKPSWRAMVDNIPTVMTQAMQVWLTPPLPDLGWKDGSTIMTGYAEPFDSWGEMSELLPREDWPETGAPRSIEYFCATMKEPPVLSPARASATVKAEAIAWLAREVPTLWPRFDWSMLHDPKERKGEERFDAQYWRANIDPSERYVLSPPGSIQYRKRADESEVDNLFLAGDWLATSINGGSVEAAVEGGMQAARAICGVPEEIHGDHGESRAPANSL